MRISHRRATLRLAQPFTISRSTSVEEEVLWIELEHEGVTGYGEAQPQDHYGETIETAEAFLDESDVAPRRRSVRARGDRGPLR